MKKYIFISVILLGFSGNSEEIVFWKKSSVYTNEHLNPIPFGPKINNIKQLPDASIEFYYELIGNDIARDKPSYLKLHKLPEIKKLDNVKIDFGYDKFPSCETLSHYSRRLHDIGKFQVYYITGAKSNPNTQSVCTDFPYTYYGYLIIYDPTDFSAKAILLFYEDYIDSLKIRKFYINSKYQIYLSDVSFSEGEKSIDKFNDKNYKIEISKDGKVSISDFL